MQEIIIIITARAFSGGGSVFTRVCLSIRLSVRPSVCPPVRPSVRLSVCEHDNS